MRKFIVRRSQKAGLSPGTLVHIGARTSEPVEITTMAYDSEGQCKERTSQDVAEHLPAAARPGVTWINVDGIHEAEVIAAIGKHFSIHPLVQEDILSPNQRPKLEAYDEYLYIVLKVLHWDAGDQTVETEQVSVILGQSFVLTFQEPGRDVFEPVRVRIRENKGRARKCAADYLAYALIDAVVDNYFLVLENLGERIEYLEEELVTEPTTSTLQEIHKFKREMISLRRAVWPLREVIGGLERGDSPLIREGTRVFLRDVYDHTIQVIETAEILREVVSGMLDIYLSSLSNRMNEVMKVLTIIATVFIPLTFISGLYGMNFDNMPELHWPWGYYSVLAGMAVVVVGMLAYFRRKKWL